LFLGWQRKDWLGVCKMGVVAFLVAATIAGWWYARNWQLYGDLTGLNAMLNTFGWRAVAPGLTELLGEFEGLRISYWGIFGWFNIPSWTILYRLLDALTLVAVAGFVLLLVRSLRARKSLSDVRFAWSALSASWVAIVLVALVRWTRMTSGTQGRLLFPAISAFSGLLVIGLAEWWPRGKRPWFVAGLSSLFLMWAAACPFAYIAPAYALPPIITVKDISAQAQPVHITYGDKLELLAYRFDKPSLAPGATCYITAYWRALDTLPQDYSFYVHLFGREGRAIGQLDTYPGGGTFPTTLWKVGQVIQERYAVAVSPEAMTPAVARVNIGAYLLENSEKLLPWRDEQGRVLDSPTIGRVRVTPPKPLSYHPTHSVSSDLGGQIRLVGYDLDRENVRPGDAFTVTLYWQAVKPLPTDYTVFVHLVGAEIVAQEDSQPYGGDYPTSAWATGEIVRDSHTVRLKPEVRPGAYQLVVGLYRLENLARLPVMIDDQPRADYVPLAQITVSW
jgi:hypothetical protein